MPRETAYEGHSRRATEPALCRRSAALSVGVGQVDELSLRVAVAVFEEKARALAGLAKGAEVYVESCLSPNTGQARTEHSAPGW
jgi:hypothetical protein